MSKKSSTSVDCPESFTGASDGMNQAHEHSYKTEYKATGMAASIHGILYQLYIIMYYILWAAEKNCPFSLLSETSGCGQLDDVIMILKNENDRTGSFIQVKHKKDMTMGQIKYEHLMKTNKNPFSIIQYFLSYRKLDKNELFNDVSNKQLYVLTNTVINECDKVNDILTKVDNQVLLETPLHINNNHQLLLDSTQCYKIKVDVTVIRNMALKKILSSKKILAYINQNQFPVRFLEYCKNDKNTWTNNLLETFLPCLTELQKCKTEEDLDPFFNLFFEWENVNKQFDIFKKCFTFVTHLPDDKGMRSLVNCKIGEKFRLLDPENLSDSFQSKIIRWLNIRSHPTLEVMTKDRATELLEDLHKIYTNCVVTGMSQHLKSELMDRNLVFKKELDFGIEVKKFLEDEVHIILEVKSDDPVLCLNLICQEVNVSEYYSQEDNFIVTRLKNILDDFRKGNYILNAFKHSNSHNLLALLVLKENNDLNKNTMDNVYENLIEILNQHKDNNFKNKIILILKPNIELSNNLVQKLPSLSTSYSFKFSDLQETSKILIMNKGILFQGKQIKINQIINENEADKLIDSEILTKILKNKLEIGDSYDYVSEKRGKGKKIIYVERTLSSQKVKLDLMNLKENQLGDNVLLLTGFKPTSRCDKKDVESLENEISKLTLENWTSIEGKRINKTIKIVTLKEPITRQNWQQFILNNKDVSNIHWLELAKVQGKTALFRWKDSTEDHSLLNDFIYESNSPGTIKDINVIDILRENRVCIISNNPGFGKSTFIRTIGRKIKTNHPSSWVYVVKLNKFGDENKEYNLNNIKNDNNSIREDEEAHLIQHLFKMILQRETSEKKRIFEQQLLFNKIQSKSRNIKSTPEIFFLFDGFDEISPAYKENTLKIIKAVCNNPAFSTLVTTRHSTRQDLEKQLQTMSLQLDLLTNENREYIIEEYLKNQRINNVRKSEIEEKIKKVDKELNDDSFSRIPLHLFMLMEIFGDDRSSMTKGQINLLTLYKAFVDIKWKKYNGEKCLGVSGNQSQTVKDILFEDKLNKIHAELALPVLMPEFTEKKKLKELNSFINLLKEKDKDGCDEISRIGIVNYSNQQLRFSHRSFAEYFLSNFLIKIKNNEFYFTTFNAVLTKKEYSLVRQFLTLQLRELKYQKPKTFNYFMKAVDRNVKFLDDQEVLKMKEEIYVVLDG